MSEQERADLLAVTELLGREPDADFVVVVRRPDGSPVVIRNDPTLRDGSPMPTLYWLVDPDLSRQVAGLESRGGVRRLAAEVDPEELEAAHAAYARARDALLRPGERAPHGGVGGTRRGVKCLHAHVAHYLAGGDDPVGALVASELTLGQLAPEPPLHDRL